MALTDAGRGAVQGCEEAFSTVRKRMLEGFTHEEQELLAQFRERMLNNLRGTPGQKEEG
jgi:DNA-binding MarR family transcriptional regulator